MSLSLISSESRGPRPAPTELTELLCLHSNIYYSHTFPGVACWSACLDTLNNWAALVNCFLFDFKLYQLWCSHNHAFIINPAMLRGHLLFCWANITDFYNKTLRTISSKLYYASLCGIQKWLDTNLIFHQNLVFSNRGTWYLLKKNILGHLWELYTSGNTKA